MLARAIRWAGPAVVGAVLAVSVGGTAWAPRGTTPTADELLGLLPTSVPAVSSRSPWPAATRILRVQRPTVAGAPDSAGAAGSGGQGDAAGSGDVAGVASVFPSVAEALAAALPGDAIELASGSYPPFVLTARGRPDAWIVIRPSPGATVVIDAAGAPLGMDIEGGRYIGIDGLTVTGGGDPFGAGILVADSSDVSIANSSIVANRGFGVRIVDSSNVSVVGNDISHDATGVEIEGGVPGTRVAGNAIHDQDRMVVDDPAPDNDRGAVGVNLYHVRGPVTIEANRLWANRAASHDYGSDGGAFDIFGAKEVTISGNLIGPGNDAVLESGTDGPQIQRVLFARNVVLDPARTMHGIVVHAGDSLTLDGNVFAGLRDFVLTVTGPDRFIGPITWLTETDDLILEPPGVVWSLGRAMPPTARMERVSIACPSGAVAAVEGQGTLRTLADLATATGLGAGSRSIDDGSLCDDVRAALGAAFGAARIPLPG